MHVANTREVKTYLSRLIERVAAGEEDIIGRAGKPVAKLVPHVEEPPAKRPFGIWKGKVWIADDFEDDLPDDLASAFSGEMPGHAATGLTLVGV